MPVRKLPEPGSVYLTQVDVTDDWTTASNAVSDIETAVNLDLSSPEHDVYFYLWEGEFDPDDLGSLKITAGGAASWTDTDGGTGSFTSPPLIDVAYILSIQALS